MTQVAKTPINWGPIAVILSVLALFAGVSVMAVVSHTIDGTQVAGFVSIVAGSTTLAGGLTLAGDGKTSDVIPHLVVLLAVIGMTVALALEHVYTSVEVTLIVSFVIGGGGTGTVAGVSNARFNTFLSAMPDQRPPAAPPAPSAPSPIVAQPVPAVSEEPIDGPPDALPIR